MTDHETDPMQWKINPYADLIDSRDVIDRIVALEADERDDDENDELAALLELADEAEGYAPDWHYGEQLIRDSYFETFAEELADDIGAVPRDVSWPMTCIDWERAADELQMDYTSVSFAGIDYWVR